MNFCGKEKFSVANIASDTAKVGVLSSGLISKALRITFNNDIFEENQTIVQRQKAPGLL